jgi:hypothetical protein
VSFSASAVGVASSALFLAGVGLLGADRGGSPPLSDPRATATCLHTIKPTDSVKAVVKMNVRPRDPGVKLPPDLEGLFVQEFKSRLKMPAVLPLSVMRGWFPCDKTERCQSGLLIFGTRAYATLKSDGTLSKVSVVDLSLTPSFADSVRSAFAKMSTDRASPFLGGLESVALRFAIEVEQDADTVPAYRKLFLVALPHYAMPYSPADYSKGTAPPKYPRIAEMNRITDTVQLTFTILENGSVAPESVDLEKAHYREFIESVFTSMSKTTYIPARIGTCAVASWVNQSFAFALP